MQLAQQEFANQQRSITYAWHTSCRLSIR
jgi:hypothetical protein